MGKETTMLFDNSERYRDLGCAIAYYRKRKRLTQEQLADRVGISRQHMGAIEAPNMVRAISLEVIFNIATVLEIEPYILFRTTREAVFGILPLKSAVTALILLCEKRGISIDRI